MTNFVDVTYQQTGKSLDTDALGMREMQRRAFEERNTQYLLRILSSQHFYKTCL